ncbi:MAG: hypothetical protein PVH30_09870 [Desulfobacterales bacterium]
MDGTCRHCDKRHLFRMAGEHRVYTGREAHLTVDMLELDPEAVVRYRREFPAWMDSDGPGEKIP